MKQNTLRILNSCGVAIAACGVGIYNTVHRGSSNSIDYQLKINYQAHPLASIIGSMIPGIIAGFAFYWWDSRRARKTNSRRTVYLIWTLLFVTVALFAFPFLQMIINKNHEVVKAVANTSTVTKTVINTVPIPAATPQEQAPTYLQLYRAANPNDSRDDISILAQAKLDGKLDAYPAEQERLNKWAKAMSDPSSEISQFYRQKKLAESGDAAAQLNLGNCYIAGKGVGFDSVEGLKWVRKAADQGNADAEFQLGLNYKMGIGVAQDYVQAWKLLKLAEAQIPSAIIPRVACESSMTPDQITEAQKLFSDFQPHTESASTNSN
jgi:hypothetical protein